MAQKDSKTKSKPKHMEVCPHIMKKCILPYLFGYKMGLSQSRMSTNNQISPMQFCFKYGFLPFLNNSKYLDPSDKTDLDFWDCFGRKKHCLITEEIRYHKLIYFLFYFNSFTKILRVSPLLGKKRGDPEKFGKKLKKNE